MTDLEGRKVFGGGTERNRSDKKKKARAVEIEGDIKGEKGRQGDEVLVKWLLFSSRGLTAPGREGEGGWGGWIRFVV